MTSYRNSVHRRSFQTATAVLLAVGATVLPTVANAAPHHSGAARTNATTATSDVTLDRDGAVHTQVVDAARTGELKASFTAEAVGADWSKKGRESAVLEVLVDGRRASNLVITSDQPTLRSIGLGTVTRGRHTLTFRFDNKATPNGIREAKIGHLKWDFVSPGDENHDELAYAPVILGRSLPALGGAYQNATTDTPLLAWHETKPARSRGHKIVEYSVVWSNEDGGTDTPALMARWGRTTDIEWVYRVELDEKGRRVPGSDVFQAPGHAPLHFTGDYEGTHPVLQTCTWNNNMCDKPSLPKGQGMRFLLDTSETRAPERARESLMDAHPWTYRVMSDEMTRENKIEHPSRPSTPEVGDQRNYFYFEFRKSTGEAASAGSNPGATIAVRLKGDPNVYRSDHHKASWSVTRDGAAATTVELPPGTKQEDIGSVVAIRTPSGAGDNGAPVTVEGINRGFFLSDDRTPLKSFIRDDTKLRLTKKSPTTILWSADERH